MKKIMIRGDRLLIALRCFTFLEACCDFGDTELAEELGLLQDFSDAALLKEPESETLNPHNYSLEKVWQLLRQKGLLSKEQREAVGSVFQEYGFTLGVLSDFLEANASQLSPVELDLSHHTNLTMLESANQWVQRFFELFLSQEISEDILR